MKLYRFYLIPDEYINDTRNLMDKYPLYAITNDKKIANKFKSQRNMKRFIKKKSSIDEEEYSSFANRHRSTVLNDTYFTYHTNRYGSDDKVQKINIAATQCEIDTIDEPEYNVSILSEIWWAENHMIPASFFTDEIQKLLGYVNYVDTGTLVGYFYDDDEEIDIDAYFESIEFDELNMLINTFGELF